MKKFKLILIFAMALGLAFTSCKKDEEVDPVDQRPNIDFKGGGNYISADATVISGEEFIIGITASSNSDSGKDLKSVKYTITSNNVIVSEFDSVFSENSYNVDYIFRMDNAGEAVINFDVTDKNNEKASISLTITAELGTTPLGDAEGLYWERVGGSPATGIEGYGLKWENNLKEVRRLLKEKEELEKSINKIENIVKSLL